jgi:phosphotriesterase-related protein
MIDDRASLGWTRREAMYLIGAAAASACGGGGAPRTPIIRTIMKDVAPDSLGTGAVVFHEHLSIDLGPRPANAPPPPTLEEVVELVDNAGRAGVSCLVDGGHPDMGRNLDVLKQVAARTPVHVVASGGYYTQATYPAAVQTKSEDELAEDLAREAAENRYGAFGEIGQAPDEPEMTPDERKVFRAVGKTHVRTGIPIFTHNNYGTGPKVSRDAGLKQLDVLEGVGVKPQAIVIGHACCLDDPKAEIIKEIAKRGAYVGFDRTTLEFFVTDEKKVQMVLAFLDAGHEDKLLLSADFTGQEGVGYSGSGGYARTLTVFVPLLRKAGVNDQTLRRITVENPRRFLAFVPKNA